MGVVRVVRVTASARGVRVESTIRGVPLRRTHTRQHAIDAVEI